MYLQWDYSGYCVGVHASAADSWWEDGRAAGETPPTIPEQEVVVVYAADVDANILEMATTDQPPLDPAEKDTWEKLTLWDRRVDALAPLTEKQMDSVLELRAAAETLSVPAEVSSAASRSASRMLLTAALCDSQCEVT